jgi:hypothetical protein
VNKSSRRPNRPLSLEFNESAGFSALATSAGGERLYADASAHGFRCGPVRNRKRFVHAGTAQDRVAISQDYV